MEKKKYKLENCPVCGSNDIVISNPQYSTFNAGDVQCKKCNWKVNVNYIDSDAGFANYWNTAVKLFHKNHAIEIRRDLEKSYCADLTNEQIEEALKKRIFYDKVNDKIKEDLEGT